MLLPIGDDNPNERPPYVHYGIVAVNVLVFFYSLRFGWRIEKFWFAWGLVPAEFSVVKLFTSMYIHSGVAHLFFNMLFLWIVGDNVEDRLGHVGYLVFYHMAGAAASLSHVAFTSSAHLPLIGASGAISGVMGAYAVFFPRAKIKIWYWLWLFFFGVVYVSAGWAVGLWFIEQVVLRTLAGSAGVSYDAHIGGIIFGVVVALVLRTVFLRKPDVVRRVVGLGGPAGRWRRRAEREEPMQALGPAAAELEAGIDDNEAIAAGLHSGDLQTAYRYFTRATAGAGRATLDEPVVMELGQALVVAGNYGGAVRVYEVMLEIFPHSPDAPEAAFRLGTLLSRAFGDFDRARPWLTRALETHPDARRRRRAFDELKRIDAHLRRIIPFRRSR